MTFLAAMVLSTLSFMTSMSALMAHGAQVEASQGSLQHTCRGTVYLEDGALVFVFQVLGDETAMWRFWRLHEEKDPSVLRFYVSNSLWTCWSAYPLDVSPVVAVTRDFYDDRHFYQNLFYACISGLLLVIALGICILSALYCLGHSYVQVDSA